jgi:hypothetical protein
MAENEAVRRNRLALLSELLREFTTVADFSEIGGMRRAEQIKQSLSCRRTDGRSARPSTHASGTKVASLLSSIRVPARQGICFITNQKRGIST